MIVGLSDGVFDLMHYAHIKHLQNCKKHCDVLIVAIANDTYAKKKGKGRPIIPEKKRLMSIQALKCVDVAFLCDGSVNVINDISPDIYFRDKDYVRHKDLKKEIKIKKMPVYYSTTKLIEHIKKKTK